MNRGAPWKPLGPQKLFRLCTKVVARTLDASARYAFAMRTLESAGAGYAEIFALTTPASNLNFLFLVYQATDFLAGRLAVTVFAAFRKCLPGDGSHE